MAGMFVGLPRLVLVLRRHVSVPLTVGALVLVAVGGARDRAQTVAYAYQHGLVR
ncbi:MAG: hypothetical protein ACRDRL_05540 [Sciscionella sp.]